MKNNLVKIPLIAFLVLLLSTCVSNGSTSNQNTGDAAYIYRLVAGKVFEVVVRKPFDSPETEERKRSEGREDEIITDVYEYKEELAWDAVNFTVRNDEFLPIGTAFAIGPREFVTAAHVLSLDQVSFWDDFYLRDGEGNVYPIGDVVKYSNKRDFVQFTLETNEEFDYLDIQRDAQLNTPVFSVGNALGEGIIVRNGLFTSRTDEEDRGEWKYLRFTAAASPGNSGGPLLNEQGEVIGIIVQKSANENLNYAVPIEELLDWQEGLGVQAKFFTYMLDIISSKIGPRRYEEDFNLPMNYRDLNQHLVEITHRWNREMKDDLVEEQQDHLYPRGEGAYQLLMNSGSYALDYPYITAERESDAIWDLFRSNDIEDTSLGDNGYIQAGNISDFFILTYRKSNDQDLEPLFSDSEFFMDEMLKGYPISRTIGGKQVRILSLGSAVMEDRIEDRYQREWLKYKWDIPFGNSQLLIYALPTPSGYYALGILENVDAVISAYEMDLEEYLNFLFFSYYGTLEEWKDFFSISSLQSDFFRNLDFDTDGENYLNLSSENFDLSFDGDRVNFSWDSVFALKATYLLKDDEPYWTPVGYILYKDESYDEYSYISRVSKPHSSLDNSMHNTWNEILYEEIPFDRSIQNSDGESCIFSLAEPFRSLDEGEKDDLQTLYTYGVCMEGNVDDQLLQDYFSAIEDGIKIHP